MGAWQLDRERSGSELDVDFDARRGDAREVLSNEPPDALWTLARDEPDRPRRRRTSRYHGLAALAFVAGADPVDAQRWPDRCPLVGAVSRLARAAAHPRRTQQLGVGRSVCSHQRAFARSVCLPVVLETVA